MMVFQMFNEYGHVQTKLGHMAHHSKLPLLEAGNDKSEWKDTEGMDQQSIAVFFVPFIIIV
jgi:hypothetical protein